MKTTFLASVLATTLIVMGCSKPVPYTGPSIDPTVEYPLTGKWELRIKQASTTPAIAYQAGEGGTLTFSQNKYSLTDQDSKTNTGTYSLVYDTTAAATVGLELSKNEYFTRLIFDDKKDNKIFLSYKKDTIWTVQGYFPADGGVMNKYVRVKTTMNAQ